MHIRNMTINSMLIGSVSMFRLCSQFFVLPFLARHLTPEDYGVIALAMPFILFSILFARSGIESALLRDEEQDPFIWSSSFWFVGLSGLFFMLMIIGIAPIAAWFFETPELFPILGWMSLGILLQALSIVPMAKLRHEKRFKLLSWFQMLSIGLGLMTAIFVATQGGGAWAIVFQGFVIHGSLLLFVFIFSGFRPKLSLKLSLIKEYLQFGYTVMGAHFVDFLKDSMRSFVIAKILGTALLGFYSLAFLFFNLPYRVINTIMPDVVYTYMVRFKDNQDLLRTMSLLIIRCLFMLVFPAMIMIAVAYDPIFRLVLSDKWALTGKLYMMAAPAAAFTAVFSVRIIFMQILGHVKKNLRFSIESLILQFAFLMVFTWYGIEWAVIGLACAMLLYLPRELLTLERYLGCRIFDIIAALAPCLIITAFGGLVYFEVIGILGFESLLYQMMISIFICLLIYAACIATQYRRIKQEVGKVTALFGD